MQQPASWLRTVSTPHAFWSVHREHEAVVQEHLKQALPPVTVPGDSLRFGCSEAYLTSRVLPRKNRRARPFCEGDLDRVRAATGLGS